MYNIEYELGGDGSFEIWFRDTTDGDYLHRYDSESKLITDTYNNSESTEFISFISKLGLNIDS